MANLQFDNLFDIVPPSEEPVVSLKYQRGVDSRSITFESGLTITFSDYMSGQFAEYLSVAKEAWKGPQWMQEGWEATLAVFNGELMAEHQRLLVVSFILGRADHIVMYG